MDKSNGNGGGFTATGDTEWKKLTIGFTPGRLVSKKTGKVYDVSQVADKEGYFEGGKIIGDRVYSGQIILFGKPLPKE